GLRLTRADTWAVDLRGDVGVRVVHARLQFVQRHLNGQLRPGGLEVLDGALHYVLSTRGLVGRRGRPGETSGTCPWARERACGNERLVPSYLPHGQAGTWLSSDIPAQARPMLHVGTLLGSVVPTPVLRPASAHHPETGERCSSDDCCPPPCCSP